MTPGLIAPVAVSRFEPGMADALTDAEVIALRYDHDAWRRPDQYVSKGEWRYHGWICGRGWGKTEFSIAPEINRRVAAGEAHEIALMAPTEERAEKVQIEALIATAPPWFKPVRYRGGLRWPNGAKATVFTPEAPGRPRGQNFDLAWLAEIVDWQSSTRLEAFHNVTTATRIGAGQAFWDTTSKGRNEVIEHLLELHDADPETYPLTRGHMCDNAMLSRRYIQAEYLKYPPGQRRDEELGGLTFAGAADAQWDQAWIDANRVAEVPPSVDLTIVSIDPALSDHTSADEIGLGLISRAHGHAYVRHDWSAKMKPEEYGKRAIDAYFDHNAAGAVIERNRLGDHAIYVLRSAAKDRSLVVREVERGTPFPQRTPGVYYVRVVTSASDKFTRASGPAAETFAGRVHHVGRFDQLETEMTTYVPGTRKSPNRLDMAAQGIAEVLELAEERPRAVVKREAREARTVQKLLRERVSKMRARGRGRMGT